MFLLWYYLYLNFCTYQDCERMYDCQLVSVRVFECVGACAGVRRACERMFSPHPNHCNQSKDNLNLVKTHL